MSDNYSDNTSAYLQAAASVISSASNAKLNRKQRKWAENDRNLRRQWQLEDEQRYRQWQLEDWNMFDSPLAQMKHFEEAGLNPNLVYDKLGDQGSPGVQTSAPGSTSAPSYLPVGDSLVQGASAMMQHIQFTQSMQMQNEMNKAQIDLLKAQTQKQLSEELQSSDLHGYQRELLETNIKKLLQDMSINQDDSELRKRLGDLEINYKNSELDRMKKELRKMDDEHKQSSAQYKLLEQEIELGEIEVALSKIEFTTEQKKAIEADLKSANDLEAQKAYDKFWKHGITGLDNEDIKNIVRYLPERVMDVLPIKKLGALFGGADNNNSKPYRRRK